MHHAEITSTAVSSPPQLEKVGAAYVQYPECLLPIIGEPVGSEPDQNAVNWPLQLGIALGTRMGTIAACMSLNTRDRCILRGRCGCLSEIEKICTCSEGVVSVIARCCSPWSVAIKRCWGNAVVRWILTEGGEFFGGRGGGCRLVVESRVRWILVDVSRVVFAAISTIETSLLQCGYTDTRTKGFAVRDVRCGRKWG